MYTDFQVPEKQFLKQMVVREHNYQTNSNIDWQNTTIYSVTPISGFKYAWEVNVNEPGDTTRLQLHINIDLTDALSPYTLEVKPNFRPGVLGDEVFVYRGTIDNAHTLYRGYRFLWIDPDFTALPILLQENRLPITTVDGDYILLV